MNFLGILSAIPKAALFLLLIVGGAIAIEVFYLNKKRGQKNPEVNLPPQTPNSLTTTPPVLETVPLTSNPPTPVQSSMPPKKLPSKKIITAIGILLLVISIPTTVILIRQRQEIRNQAAYSCQDDANCPGGMTCDYTQCKPCSDFSNDEPRCWTHGVSCYYGGGECQPKPPGGGGGGTDACSAKNGSLSVTNTGDQTISGSYFASTCSGGSGYCGGESTPKSLAPGESFSTTIDTSDCGSWQVDINIGPCQASAHGTCGGGGGDTPPPNTPTPPPQSNNICQAAGVFDSNWVAITDLSTLTVGQTVFLTTHGSTTDAAGITMARFRINGGAWQQTTTKHGNDFYIQYTVGDFETFKIESMVFNPTQGWF